MIPASKQGHYQRTGVLLNNKALNKKATKYIRKNAPVKGKFNLTASTFCQWVKEELLPNETLEPGCPRMIAIETALKWMHEMGYEVLTSKKGVFVDNHERHDVVEYRKMFLRRMVALGFLNEGNAPTDEAKQSLPSHLECPQLAVFEKAAVVL